MKKLFLIVAGLVLFLWIVGSLSTSTPSASSTSGTVAGKKFLAETERKFEAEREADPSASKEEIVCRARRKTAIQEGDDPDVAYSNCISAMRRLGIK